MTMHCHMNSHSDTGIMAVVYIEGGEGPNENLFALAPGTRVSKGNEKSPNKKIRSKSFPLFPRNGTFSSLCWNMRYSQQSNSTNDNYIDEVGTAVSRLFERRTFT